MSIEQFWQEMWNYPPQKEKKEPKKAQPRDYLTGEQLVRNDC